MFRARLVLALAGAALSASPVLAQDASSLPLSQPLPEAPQVLLLSQDRLFSGTLYGKAVQARIEEASRGLQAENRRIEADLEAEERALTEQRKTLPPDEFRTLAEAFDAKVEGIRAAQEAKARSITQDRETERQRFFETAVPILAELMAEQGAVAIIDKNAVILSFDRIDITDTAIARIDAKLGDGSALPE
ncbi:OmpH family outer membrane protein [Aliigemmobacter aestuarii]|uniref:OmpH family outer membrane protein n=1 Tax=Aliigemmobacter aestuarii TaxID=1445661 RepID=A0A4S3MR17_9RHOB|nr:OmpH family outer membrane protein [Gemmobacter aestuarii]THD84473.1 OmpH family outer membrane protein [Gemmobacter aestuarii]